MCRGKNDINAINRQQPALQVGDTVMMQVEDYSPSIYWLLLNNIHTSQKHTQRVNRTEQHRTRITNTFISTRIHLKNVFCKTTMCRFACVCHFGSSYCCLCAEESSQSWDQIEISYFYAAQTVSAGHWNTDKVFLLKTLERNMKYFSIIIVLWD